jgi:F0F1-type ATP synthase assembly protein I
MSVLEDRYRSVLRMLPASYREVWEEEMVSTFLESMDTDDVDEAEFRADFGRPGFSEVASVAALAARLRFGGTDAPPRSFAWGEAVRRVALVGFLAYAAYATVLSVERLWLSGAVPWPPLPDHSTPWVHAQPTGFWPTLRAHAGLVWLGAFLALAFGRRGAATVFAVVGVLVPLSDATLHAATSREPVMLSPWFGIGVSALLVVALAAFHSGAPPVRPRPWLGAFGVGLVLGGVPEFVYLRQDIPTPSPLEWPAVACVVMVVAAGVHVGRRTSSRWRGALSWSLALAFLAAIVLGQRVVSLIDLRTAGPYPGRSTMITLAVAEALAVLAILLLLVVATVRGLRQLPLTGASVTGSRAPSP